MHRLARTAVVSLGLLLALTSVAHADGLGTIPYGDNCWAYLSAHRKSSCDSSAWYSYDQLEYSTASDPRNAYRGWPTLYVAEDKHAT